jgi:Domain of unknown function (DUF4272)
MAVEPITLYARQADPAGVARLLRERWPGVEFDQATDEWVRAIVRVDGKTLTLTHDPAYYADPNWSIQMRGMEGYFSRFPETGRKKIALMLPSTFKFCTGALFNPEPDSSSDTRFEVLFAIAELLDGVFFTPSSLRDKRGRILYGAGGEDDEDSAAEWPAVIADVTIPGQRGAGVSDPMVPSPAEAPTAERVARRALALTAVTARAILEQDGVTLKPGNLLNPMTWARQMFTSREGERHQVVAWIEAVGIVDELDPDEWEVVQRPVGRLEPQQQTNSTWRLEGLAVLAWAMKRYVFPRHDKLVECNAIWRRLGLLDATAARALLAEAPLRPRSEIAALRNRLFGIHWRLTDFRLRPGAMDYGEFSRKAWFGPLDAGLPLVDGDLAIGKARIDKAPPDAISNASSAALERHLAINWLWEGPIRYADASVAT